jgi:hypothetical protein
MLAVVCACTLAEHASAQVNTVIERRCGVTKASLAAFRNIVRSLADDIRQVDGNKVAATSQLRKRAV